MSSRNRRVACKSDSVWENYNNYFFISIILAGRGYISTEAAQLLSGRNVNIILVDSFLHLFRRRLVANINYGMSSHAGTKYRIGQYDTFRNPKKVLHLQKQLLTAKL